MSKITMLEVLGIQNKAEVGDVGIEIEVEGINLPQKVTGYRCEHDGSIKAGGVEYVFRHPVSVPAARQKLGVLTKAFAEAESLVDTSMRAGVHCHVNVQNLTPIEVYNFITMYLVLEELLLKFCGPTRQGNLFCLRALDAEYLLFQLRAAAEAQSFHPLSNDNLRYGSLNVKALSQYGSLEFRAMESSNNMKQIGDWADILTTLRDNSSRFDNPISVITTYSDMCVEDFLIRALGPWADKFREYDGWQDIVKDGMRRTQLVAYATDWDHFAFSFESAFSVDIDCDEEREDWEDDDEEWIDE